MELQRKVLVRKLFNKIRFRYIHIYIHTRLSEDKCFSRVLLLRRKFLKNEECVLIYDNVRFLHNIPVKPANCYENNMTLYIYSILENLPSFLSSPLLLDILYEAGKCASPVKINRWIIERQLLSWVFFIVPRGVTAITQKLAI